MFNVLRYQLKAPLRRSYATTAFVPPAATSEVAPAYLRTKRRPASPTFYTGRPAYFDHVDKLESAITTTRSILRGLQLLPLPKFAWEAIPKPRPAWKEKEVMGNYIETKLSTARYRRLISLLNQLDEYRRISETAGCVEIAKGVAEVISLFEKDNKADVLERGKRKPVKFDEYGRSYTVGRRKESSARVWMIPVQTKSSPTPTTPSTPPSPTPSAVLAAPEIHESEPAEATDLTPSLPQALTTPQEPVEVTSTNIIINNAPLIRYFPHAVDREKIMRPFKVAGLVGAFNVFAIVRGGGSTGQSGAVALGIAKGLAAHVPEVGAMLKKAQLLRRDPRMVERKKTGRPKAREGYTWVKR
ncbi:ribosomal protein S5 domain 2-like protein [Panus rudis PR-1116 ss-1]|nr:ribosomal protein S5 domain 2-like protein [Panus rudis PR-1116 ss-1]